MAGYTREDLGATTLVLSPEEMALVGEAGERAAAAAAAAAAAGRVGHAQSLGFDFFW